MYTGRCFREWCNWQHTGFWSRYWGFESSLPSQLKLMKVVGSQVVKTTPQS